MIRAFAGKTTADIFHGRNSKDARRVPREVWAVAARKLDMLNRATSIQDLRVPPRNRLEKLKGSLVGFYSIRVNDQFRVVFGFDQGGATEVRIADYH